MTRIEYLDNLPLYRLHRPIPVEVQEKPNGRLEASIPAAHLLAQGDRFTDPLSIMGSMVETTWEVLTDNASDLPSASASEFRWLQGYIAERKF